MELGISFSEFLFFLILSAFLCLVVILPSDAMQSAGFTISKVFAFWLGDERFNFVEYHLRRTLLTIMVHASLPFLCFVGLELCVPQPVFTPLPHNLIQIMAYLSIAFSAATACFCSILYLNDWERHYMIRRLRLLNNPQDGPWRELAIQINIEVRRPMLFSMINKDCSRTIITDEWILKITNYNVNFARISDSQLVIVRSSPLHQSVPSHDGLVSTSAEHLIDLRVCSRSGYFETFHIRIRNQQELNNLKDQIGRPIEVLDSLALPQPLHERFVDAFIKELERNPRYDYKQKEDLEPCLGCSQLPAQVKLVKKCIDSPDIQDGASYEKCRNCQCRPMWCARCMGRIFASKQNQNLPEIWMAGRAPCPTCRLPFCVLDVCFLTEKD
uniref:Uncharacterized protein n=1 Tax=Meloidogyne enterolobii TaxID=390850 RepID=A0A6V7WAW6_MELEN|nr:unnamed protein product [Meloidogyne enterolobii]